MGNPLAGLRRNVTRYLFLDTHLYFANEFAFHALALDEHRRRFEPTFWSHVIPTLPQPALAVTSYTP